MEKYRQIAIGVEDVVPVAKKMKQNGIALVMIHAYINGEGKFDVSWEYAVNPMIESYHVVGESSFPSLGDIYDTAATWPEREINELFGIEFEGLDVSKRLFLPEEMLDAEGKGQIFVMPLSELRSKNIKESE